MTIERRHDHMWDDDAWNDNYRTATATSVRIVLLPGGPPWLAQASATCGLPRTASERGHVNAGSQKPYGGRLAGSAIFLFLPPPRVVLLTPHARRGCSCLGVPLRSVRLSPLDVPVVPVPSLQHVRFCGLFCGFCLTFFFRTCVCVRAC